MTPSIYWIPLLPLIGAAVNLVFGRWLGRGAVHFVAVLAVAASFGAVLVTVFDPLLTAFKHRHEGAPVEIYQHVYTWIQVDTLKIDMAFRLDTLSAVMCLIITGVGTLIHVYSTGYMADEPRYAAYFGYLNLFTGSMLILVLGANLPVMFIGWEGVGVCSFLLIGFWFTNEAYATAGRKAFVVNRIGDFAFLIGMFLLYMATKDLGATNSLDFSTFRNPAAQTAYHAPFWLGERYAMWACLFLFIGACGKSAQIPLYVWLPDAMAGPTPVSALIHAATMVTAGVYMVARMSFVFMSSSTVLAVVAGVGATTALLAAFMAFAQTDLKRVLAYSTVSQLGFMFVGVGTGNWTAGIFHLGTHAFFKAGLFLGAGSVMHAMSGSGDIMKMGGLRKKLPITHATFLVYCLAITGFPFLAGFFSKDEILGGAYGMTLPDIPRAFSYLVWGALTLAALGTSFYMWRLYFLVFSGDCRADEETKAHIHESPLSMTIPLIVLAVLAIFAGYLGLPHLHGVHLPDFTHWLDTWLEPSVAPSLIAHASDARTGALVGVATFGAIAGLVAAWVLYRNGPSKQVEQFTQTELGGQLYQASKHKLWVDEIYDSILVRPFRWLARALFEFVDRFLIDTVLVNGSAWVVAMFGRLMRWVQNGQVQRYMVGIIVGAAAVFFLSTRAAHPQIEWKRVGDGDVELRAYAGAGLAGNGAKLRWDLNGDGEWDLTRAALDALAKEPKPGEPPRVIDPEKDYLSDPVIVRSNSSIGPYVRLEITDPVTHGKRVVTTHVPMLVSATTKPVEPKP